MGEAQAGIISARREKRRNPRRKTVPPDIIQVLVDGQKRLFELLDDVRMKVENIGIQSNEITHINSTLLDVKKVAEDHETRIDSIETSCITNHVIPDRREPSPEKSFGQRLAEACIMTVVVGAVAVLCSILGFTMFVNTQAYFDFQHTQISPPAPKPAKQSPSHQSGQ
jgi:hypothetical protein